MTAQNEPLDIDPRFTNSEGVVRAIEKKRNKIMQNEHKPTYEQKRYQMGAQAVPALQNEPQLSAELPCHLVEKDVYWSLTDADDDYDGYIHLTSVYDGSGMRLSIADVLATALEEQREELFAKYREDTKELRHFHDTTIGLLATDRSYEDIIMIIYDAIEASFDMSGMGKPTADVCLPVILAAQDKLKKIMWRIEPIKVAILKKARE